MTATQTTVDWLAFRTKAMPDVALEGLRPMFGANGIDLTLRSLERGKDGWLHAAELCIGDMRVGRVDYGGSAMRDWARWNITGKGCEWVRDWDAVDEVEKLPAAQIKRLDIALTTWDGEVTHDMVVAAHEAGKFCSGGRPPALQQITSSDPMAGNTCNIGKREKADKFLRCYEKGKQLRGQLGALGRTVTHIDGHLVEDIYRSEVELKAVARPIPWEVVERRDQYFAGSYPFLAELLPQVGCDILLRRPERAPQTALRVALENCRIQYGQTLFTALMVHGGDMTRVWDSVIGTKHNEALLEAGVLLVDHE